MKLELSIKVNEPTLNNRIYPQQLMLNAIKIYKENYITCNRSFLYFGYDNDITDIICPISDVMITDDGRIELLIDENINPNNKSIVDYTNKSLYNITSVGIGKLSEPSKEDGHFNVIEYELTHFSSIPIPANKETIC